MMTEVKLQIKITDQIEAGTIVIMRGFTREKEADRMIASREREVSPHTHLSLHPPRL
jgi:hypothetical protein